VEPFPPALAFSARPVPHSPAAVASSAAGRRHRRLPRRGEEPTLSPGRRSLEVDRIVIPPDGQAVIGFQVSSGDIILAKLPVNIKNAANLTRRQ